MNEQQIKSFLLEQPRHIIYGVSSLDIVKLIDLSDKTHFWDNDYFDKVERALEKLLNTQKKLN